MMCQYAFIIKVATVQEPESSEAAKAPRWVEVMNKEMQSLNKKKTWDLVPHSPHKKAIGCKWIFKVKYNVDGFVIHYCKGSW